MINVTKTFLPPLGEYVERLARVWDGGVITNHGPATAELECALRETLDAPHCLLVSNGTLAIQLAIKALGLAGEIITTPFSYVATTSSVVWEGCTPVFADVDAETLTIDPERVEAAVTPRTSAILATHVYGHPCDVDALADVAGRHGLRVIYDAAHCFGARYQGRSLTTFGDVSTLSFHATKLFHTVEGGAVVAGDADVAHRLSYMRNFGHDGPEAFQGVGINAKISELHSIMGLCVLPHIPEIVARRRGVTERYDAAIAGNACVRRPRVRAGYESNYAYYPVVYEDEAALLRARARMNAAEIFPRRYFYPSLSKLPYITGPGMPVAENLARRVLCLPLSASISEADADRVAELATPA
jgi:dTDP-4-amino-4,6-dideoxygalactose transaminase